MVFPNAPVNHPKMGYIIPIRIRGEIMAMIFLRLIFFLQYLAFSFPALSDQLRWVGQGRFAQTPRATQGAG
jgi:hypothetical protein